MGADKAGGAAAAPEKGFDTKKFFLDLASGGTAAVVSKTAVAAVRAKYFLKVQADLQTIAAFKYIKGIIDVLVRVPKEQGFAAVWRVNLANVSRYVPTRALNFAFNDTFQNMFHHRLDKKKDFWKYTAGNLVSGGAAGATSLCFVYPLDVARTRLAADVGKAKTSEFKGLADCLIKIAKSDFPISLYRGFFGSVSVQGIIIYRALYFGLYDTAKNIFTKDGQKLDFFAAWGIAQVTTFGSIFFSSPWYIDRRLMIQSGCKDVLCNSTWDFANKIIKNEGMGIVYKGALSNVFRGTSGALVLVKNKGMIGAMFKSALSCGFLGSGGGALVTGELECVVKNVANMAVKIKSTDLVRGVGGAFALAIYDEIQKYL